MAYTTINKPTDYFNTKLYTGNGNSSQSITGVNFKPDWVWVKNRGTTDDHVLHDVVRGAGKRIKSNSNAAEATVTNQITAFTTDGFTSSNSTDTGANSNNYVAWNWKAGTSFTNNAGANGANLATTAGSVNTDAGFSILKWNSSGMAGEGLLAHGLGVVPSVIIIKSTSGADDWYTYHKSLGATKYVRLNQNAAQSSSTWLENKTPTATLISLDNGFWGTSSIDYITYCFAEKKGYSKFGSYTGNGNADGPFIYTGFAPSWVMIKKTDTAEDWFMVDNKREPINPLGVKFITANNETAEQTSSNKYIDFLSNGFKCRASTGYHNDNPDPYIYMAFAEAPLVGTNGVTAKAR